MGGSHCEFVWRSSKFRKESQSAEYVFGTVAVLPPVHNGNVVALAFKPDSKLRGKVLRARAEITQQTKLPAQSWLDLFTEIRHNQSQIELAFILILSLSRP